MGGSFRNEEFTMDFGKHIRKPMDLLQRFGTCLEGKLVKPETLL